MTDVGKAILGGINAAFGTAENEPQNPVNVYSYEDLGKFEQKISKSEERVYLQGGYTRKLKPRAMEILFQEPDVTIVIKKRQFSSLAENYRLDRLDQKTRTYIKAVKRLFYNKCRRIAAYERLTKLEKIYSKSAGQFNDLLFPAVFSFIEFFNAAGGLGESNTSSFASSIKNNFSILDTLKKLKNLSDPQLFTTWSNPAEIPYLADVGEGTGTFELTLATSINTTVSTQMGQGSCSITFENPLELMIITQEDIEEAISDVVGFTNNGFFNFIKGQLNDVIKNLMQQLNSKRMDRGASSIIINTNPDTLQFKKIRAFIDGEGREILFNYDAGLMGIGGSISLDQSAREGFNGLTSDEEKLFSDIITNYYSLLDNEKLTRNQIINFNQENDYVRKKMRLEFEDRCIIQQQDVVHVFVSSKSSLDPAVSSGFNFSYSKDNFFNQIDKQLNNIENLFNDLSYTFAGKGSNFIEYERNAIVGPDFPLWLWMTMRNDFTRQAAGTHVFAGIADDIRQEYSSGQHKVTLTCKDFTDYLQKGQINIKPSSDVIDSSIYDPLTPFKTEYDPANGILQGLTPQLLDENVALLNTGFVRYKAGRNKGSTASTSNYEIQDIEIVTPESPFAKKRIQFFDPDGFVYRWKEGIGTLILSGAPHSYGTGSLRKETSSMITTNVFSGQDVMNTLSLLITGQPYNFSSFLKSAAKSGFITTDKRISYSSSENFLKGLITDINKTNSIWGNFVPFKRLGLTDAAYRKILQGEFDASVNNQYINDLLAEKARLLDELASLVPGANIGLKSFKVGASNSPAPSATDLPIGEGLRVFGTSIFELDQKINSFQEKFLESVSTKNISGIGGIKIYGDDISVETVDMSSASDEKKLKAKEQFNKKLLYLTQRRLWKVKANDDQNYFIVDDSYDKNYDIQAFEDSLTDLGGPFQSTYTSIFDQVKQAGDLLGLEIFADSQGHINARPPAYNRIPSSVLFNLVKIKDQKGIKLFPDYLESLFFNQVKGLTEKIEILEDRIRLRAYLLGGQNDYDIGNLLGGSKEVTGNALARFSFVTDPVTGKLEVEGFQSLLLQSDPDFTEEANRTPLISFNTKLTKAINTNVQFDIVKRASLLTTRAKAVNSDKIKEVQNRLKAKYYEDEIVKDVSNYRSERGNLSQVKMLELFSQIVPLISERQAAIKTLANSVKNLEEGTSINQEFDASTPIFSTLNSKINNGKIPEILLHMVEDEDVDDLGPGSGARYIIKDSQIISFSISENAPPFTIVEVTGSPSNNLVNAPSGIEVGRSGNIMNTACVADYDMWRLYGFKGTHPVSIPILSDATTQCAPYGVFLLNQARKNIFTVNITMVGNEYIQAGEVYYLESRDLLFYAESVSHAFDFSGSFQTTIKGTYTRKPGEFIPTMLDIIGKGLYTRRNQADIIKNIRNVTLEDQSPLGALKAEEESFTSEDAEGSSEKNSFSEMNRQTISSILFSVSGLLNPSSYGKNVKVELRVYHDSSPDSDLTKYAGTIKEFLINPEKFTTSTSTSTTVPDDQITNSLSDKDIEIVPIKLGTADGTELRTPSSEAWDLARRLIEYPSGSNITPDLISNGLKNNLFKYVIDVWAVFSDNTETGLETSNGNNEKTDENSQKLENFLKSLAGEVLQAEETKKKVNETIKTVSNATKK
jgi:hypothetical protein